MIVQYGIYRYGVAQYSTTLVRPVLCNHLETKVCWNDHSWGACLAQCAIIHICADNCAGACVQYQTWSLAQMADLVRVQVLMPRTEADRFDIYCREKGYKKSPLIARLVREYLSKETSNPQPDLFNRDQRESEEL